MDTEKALLFFGSAMLIFGIWVKEPVVKEIKVYPAPLEAPIQVVTTPVVKDTNLEAKNKHCLAVMIYGEARGESFYGKSAVAYTAINRLEKGGYKNICAVVLDKSQYTAFSRNRKLITNATYKTAPANNDEWKESAKVAELAYTRVIPDPTKGATHFVNPRKLKIIPRWVRVFRQTVRIDNHTFYKHV